MVTSDEIVTVVKGLPKYVMLSEYGNDNGQGSLRDPRLYDFKSAIASFDIKRIHKAVQEIPEHFRMMRTFSKATSYGLKHYLEHKTGDYITNGDFIVAMILCGYRVKFPNRSVNCVINCKQI